MREDLKHLPGICLSKTFRYKINSLAIRHDFVTYCDSHTVTITLRCFILSGEYFINLYKIHACQPRDNQLQSIEIKETSLQPRHGFIDVVSVQLAQVVNAVHAFFKTRLKLVPENGDHLVSDVLVQDPCKVLHLVPIQLQRVYLMTAATALHRWSTINYIYWLHSWQVYRRLFISSVRTFKKCN